MFSRNGYGQETSACIIHLWCFKWYSLTYTYAYIQMLLSVLTLYSVIYTNRKMWKNNNERICSLRAMVVPSASPHEDEFETLATVKLSKLPETQFLLPTFSPSKNTSSSSSSSTIHCSRNRNRTTLKTTLSQSDSARTITASPSNHTHRKREGGRVCVRTDIEYSIQVCIFLCMGITFLFIHRNVPEPSTAWHGTAWHVICSLCIYIYIFIPLWINEWNSTHHQHSTGYRFQMLNVCTHNESVYARVYVIPNSFWSKWHTVQWFMLQYVWKLVTVQTLFTISPPTNRTANQHTKLKQKRNTRTQISQ